MLVRDVMTRQVISATPQTTLPELIDLMLERNVTGVPIIDDDGSLVGVVTETDLVARQAYGGSKRPRLSALKDLLAGHRNRWWQKAAAVTTAEIMTSPARTVRDTESLRAAASTMLARNVNRLVAVDQDGRVVGIVSRRDVLRPFHRTDDAVAADVSAVLTDPLRCPEDHGVTLTCVSDGVAYVSGWTHTDVDAEMICAIVGAIPGVIDVKGGIGRRDRHHPPMEVHVTPPTVGAAR
jgi:CBS domain-containing protein